MRRGATALAAALLLAGCGDGDTADEPTREAGRALPQTCTNEPGGFTVGYPEGWHTNAGDVAPACTFFHPEPFELPEASEALDVAIRVAREPVPIDRVAGDYPAREVTSRGEVQVGGRAAVRIEYTATGEALLPEGTRGTEYAVDLDGETLVATTFDLGGLDYRRNVEALDAMMESLRLE